jgi:hypothetical protein
MFIGWDWASTTHDITLLDERGFVVDRWALPHTEQALTQTLDRLARHGDPAELPVIIERPDGLVVDRLLAAGTRSSPCIPPRFTPRVPAGAPPAPSPTPATATNSPTTCAAGLEKLIKELVTVHPRARLLAALPGVGQINLAQLLAEVGPILLRVDTAEQAAAECGTTPGDQSLRQGPRRLLPLGRQHPSPHRHHRVRAQRPHANHPGRPSSTPTPEHAANATPTPSASSPAPGSVSSGLAGTPTRLQPGRTPRRQPEPRALRRLFEE